MQTRAHWTAQRCCKNVVIKYSKILGFIVHDFLPDRAGSLWDSECLGRMKTSCPKTFLWCNFHGVYFYSVGGAIFMALEGPEEREICRQMQEEIKERLKEQFFRFCVSRHALCAEEEYD